MGPFPWTRRPFARPPPPFFSTLFFRVRFFFAPGAPPLNKSAFTGLHSPGFFAGFSRGLTRRTLAAGPPPLDSYVASFGSPAALRLTTSAVRFPFLSTVRGSPFLSRSPISPTYVDLPGLAWEPPLVTTNPGAEWGSPPLGHTPTGNRTIPFTFLPPSVGHLSIHRLTSAFFSTRLVFSFFVAEASLKWQMTFGKPPPWEVELELV